LTGLYGSEAKDKIDDGLAAEPELFEDARIHLMSPRIHSQGYADAPSQLSSTGCVCRQRGGRGPGAQVMPP